MQLHNLTPLSATAFRQLDPQGALDCVVAVRGRFRLRLDAPMTVHPRQPDLQWADAYEADPHASCMVRSTDLAPFKPGTDVSFLGSSFAPDGVAARSWEAAIEIAGRLDRRLRVTGPRQWTPSPLTARQIIVGHQRHKPLDRWALTEPVPAISVAMTWALAFGGAVLGTPESQARQLHPGNPLGPGLLDGRHTARDRDYPAPQIEPADRPLDTARDRSEPAGFGLIPPWWPSRLQFAGTYDEAWRTSRHPLLPQDFDDRFWQAAAPGMVIEPWLEGDEAFTLTNLHPAQAKLSGLMPQIRLVVRIHQPGEAKQDRELALDGVQFDLREGVAECDLTWRVRFALPSAGRASLALRATDMAYQRGPLARATTLQPA